jgi:hypothetical protein
LLDVSGLAVGLTLINLDKSSPSPPAVLLHKYVQPHKTFTIGLVWLIAIMIKKTGRNVDSP